MARESVDLQSVDPQSVDPQMFFSNAGKCVDIRNPLSGRIDPQSVDPQSVDLQLMRPQIRNPLPGRVDPQSVDPQMFFSVFSVASKCGDRFEIRRPAE